MFLFAHFKTVVNRQGVLLRVVSLNFGKMISRQIEIG